MNELKALYPDAIVEGIIPNLSKLEDVRKAFQYVAEKYGRLDILVNNAGVSESTPFEKYEDDTFDKVMDLNVRGMFNGSKAASEIMIPQGSGVILSTSSMVSKYGQPSGIAYPTSKFAVNGFTLSLARELGPKGIRVNAVAPGITETVIPASAQSLTISSPGSLMAGIPASVITAQDSPDKSRATSLSPLAFLLCSW